MADLTSHFHPANGAENPAGAPGIDGHTFHPERVHPLPRWTYPIIAMGVAAAGACLYFTIKAINGF